MNYENAIEYLEKKLQEHRRIIWCRPYEPLAWDDNHWHAWREVEDALLAAITACKVLAKKEKSNAAKTH